MKEIKDLVYYLSDFDEKAKKLNPKQKKELHEIIRTILILLVALRKSSHLGEVVVNYKNF